MRLWKSAVFTVSLSAAGIGLSGAFGVWQSEVFQMMGGPGVHTLVYGGSLLVFAFALFCIYHLYRSPKGRKLDAIRDCLIAMVIWVLVFAASLECAFDSRMLLNSEEAISLIVPLSIFAASIVFSRRRW